MVAPLCSVFIDLKGDEPAPLLSNFVNHGGLFPNGLAAILLTMVTDQLFLPRYRACRNRSR
ncbi:hypothetical protein AAHB62_08005 [Bacillus cereus]